MVLAGVKHATGMGWLWIDPTGKWGFPKAQALRSIRDEAGIDLETFKESTENTWLLGELVLMRGNNEFTYYDLLFKVGFNAGRLSGLTIWYSSAEASVVDVQLLWNTLVHLAADRFDAPIGAYKVGLLNRNYKYNSSTHTHFGNGFKNGHLRYSIDWQKADTVSELSVYRETIDGHLRSFVKLEHVAK